MSQGLIGCTIAKAINGGTTARDTLIATLKQPAFTLHPCVHTPKCQIVVGEEEQVAFLTKLEEDEPEVCRKLCHLLLDN